MLSTLTISHFKLVISKTIILFSHSFPSATKHLVISGLTLLISGRKNKKYDRFSYFTLIWKLWKELSLSKVYKKNRFAQLILLGKGKQTKQTNKVSKPKQNYHANEVTGICTSPSVWKGKPHLMTPSLCVRCTRLSILWAYSIWQLYVPKENMPGQGKISFRSLFFHLRVEEKSKEQRIKKKKKKKVSNPKFRYLFFLAVLLLLLPSSI